MRATIGASLCEDVGGALIAGQDSMKQAKGANSARTANYYEAEQFRFQFQVEDRPIPFEEEHPVAGFILSRLGGRFAFYIKSSGQVIKKH